MGLKEQLLEDYKAAMKAHDVSTKETVNLVRAAIKQHEIDQQVTLETDEDIFPIIKKQLKMRKDALDDFRKAGRKDLLEGYQKEIEILQSYLPEELSEEEIRASIVRIAEDSGIERSMKNMGLLIKRSMAELKGRADGSVVAGLVKEYLGQ